MRAVKLILTKLEKYLPVLLCPKETAAVYLFSHMYILVVLHFSLLSLSHFPSILIPRYAHCFFEYLTSIKLAEQQKTSRADNLKICLRF